jgi:signal transduction histidine kinase
MLFRDLTPFERGDEQERLRERLAALGQMAAGMAHEIRNPLASMEVIAGLLKRRLEGQPEELALLLQLVGELRSVARSISDCLEFVRPVAIERRRVDPRELVEESLRAACKRFAFAGRIERHYAPELPGLDVDAELLRSVLTNLIVNAFEAMETAPGPPLLELGIHARLADPAVRAVRVDADGRAAAAPAESSLEFVIAVSDNGGGVPAALRERIFYPFFTTKERGSGVGLALAQKLVLGHGGALELDSEAGEGATFRVRLPAAGAKLP